MFCHINYLHFFKFTHIIGTVDISLQFVNNFNSLKMDWHVFRNVENIAGNGKFLINCTLKSGILKMIIMQNSVARSAEVGKKTL